MRRTQVEAALAAHYSKKFNGKVWCLFDTSKRAYCIRGENLPAAKDLQHLYPNGWGLMDFIRPTKAREIAKTVKI